ncbi:glycosyltransferase family 2 protein [Aliifodinibius sp. S!AR15-10]|uniref:glycosyltransferase family 2 protein n=1 Tax=Aliifodinibius sp. S!AR15-10 TaxID=2950437 RepID=UPI00285701BA|nr:glycosyltransferase family 2 protein [Aliifodinibius sp. S!AR15-10]MDR8393530.1 glycosyltransferase family 2 protein [Aliifodinibius sp. S!AR15-10]
MAKQNSKETEIEISVVVPLFNEEQSLAELHERITSEIGENFSHEIIFIDDGSSDDSWEVIEKLACEHKNTNGIRFQRNYGKSSALQSGFERAKGKYIVTMDADLQDDPAEIPEMIEMLKNGHDLVSGWKKKRHDPLSKTIPSKFFNKVTSWVTGIDLHDFNCGLKAYKREVIENIHLYGELHRYIPLLAKWEGFKKIGEKVVQHHPRKFGETKFGFSRFMHGFLDLVTLVFINSYLQRPMHFFGTLGFIFLVIGGLINAYLAIAKIFFGEYLSGRPLLLLGVMLMVLGAQFFSIGFLGELINRNKGEPKKTNVKEKIDSH